ncbi:hypothetical protein BGX30_012290 [Mortierella sp. GBA39]|nr:hypothetical protein BGX30_012290 [Mortierella sp. GBA39]
MERLTLLEFSLKNKLVQRAAVSWHFALLDRFRKYRLIAQITKSNNGVKLDVIRYVQYVAGFIAVKTSDSMRVQTEDRRLNRQGSPGCAGIESMRTVRVAVFSKLVGSDHNENWRTGRPG